MKRLARGAALAALAALCVTGARPGRANPQEQLQFRQEAVKVVEVREWEEGGKLIVSGVVKNLSADHRAVSLRVQAKRRGGSLFQTILPIQPGGRDAIPPYGGSSFRVDIPGGLLGTAEAAVEREVVLGAEKSEAPGGLTRQAAPPEAAKTEPEAKGGLQEYALRLKDVPASELDAKGTLSGGRPLGDRVRLAFASMVERDGGVSLVGFVRNTTEAPLLVALLLTCVQNGEVTAMIVTPDNGPRVAPNTEGAFSADFPGATPGCLAVFAYSLSSPVRIIRAEEKRLKSCLTFRAQPAAPDSEPGTSLEIVAKNGCDETVPAPLTGFLVTVRDHFGGFRQSRQARFREGTPPRGEIRRQLTIDLPRHRKISIEPAAF